MREIQKEIKRQKETDKRTLKYLSLMVAQRTGEEFAEEAEIPFRISTLRRQR